MSMGYISRAAFVAALAALATACGSDAKTGTDSTNSPNSPGSPGSPNSPPGSPNSPGSPGGCTAPVLVGSPFGASGTATVTGTGTLPDGIADGLEVQVLVDQPSISIGVLADDLLSENDRVCGKTFKYTIHSVAAGTYRLGFDVFDTNSDSTMPKYEGEGASDFTIADGQTLNLDTVFHLTSGS